tara:strand:- start:579 stop:809 length:231 start_codon:yes stop_codon:yes gene_type:complete
MEEEGIVLFERRFRQSEYYIDEDTGELFDTVFTSLGEAKKARIKEIEREIKLLKTELEETKNLNKENVMVSEDPFW